MTLPQRPQRVKAEDLAERQGWERVLKDAGFPSSMLHRRHQACPMCGTGKDRFKFYDLDTGKNWCNVCGMGGGMRVLIAHLGTDFIGACNWIRDRYASNEAAAAPVYRDYQRSSVRDQSNDALRAKYRALWHSAKPILPGTPAWLYLQRRTGGKLDKVPSTLRWHPELEYWEEATEEELLANPRKRWISRGKHAAMLAAIQGMDDRVVNIHRYYLTPDGELADVRCAKKGSGRYLDSMPFAARLFEPGEVLGIGEGLENALAEGIARGIPVWATVNAGGMKKFDLPECAQHVKTLYIFGDNDAPDQHGRRAGNEAVAALAKRMRDQGRKVIVIMPASTRYDFSDIRVAATRVAA